MKSRLLSGILALALLAIYSGSASADPPPFTIESNVFAYQHILGDQDDVLILGRYDLGIDGSDDSPDPPLFTPNDWDDLWDADNDAAAKPDSDDRYLNPVDALFRVEDITGALLAGTHPVRLGDGVVGFYFPDGSVPFVFGDTIFLELQGNPSTVGIGAADSVEIDIRVTADHDETSLELAEDILQLITDIENEFDDFSPGELLTIGFINIDGRTLLQEAFPLIDQVAPTAFTLSDQVIPVDDFTPGSDQLQDVVDATLDSGIAAALQGAADIFDLSADFFGLILALVLAVPMGALITKASDKSAYGIFSIMLFMTWMSLVSFVPVIFILIAAALFFAIGGMWLATRIPI